MAELDLGEIAEREIAKRDRKIKKLEEENASMVREINTLRSTLGSLKKLKEAVLESSDWLDPLRYEDL